MRKTVLRLLLGSVLLIAAQACAPGGPTVNPNAINTAIAQTIAALTQTAEPEIPVTSPESPTPIVTTVVPTATSSPVSIFTNTPVVTPAVPQISVTVPTNCRVGPGIGFERVGVLLVDEVAEVVGRDAAGNYWIIRNPDRAGVCWVWGEYAVLAGSTSVLPIFTPPPRPTPTATSTPAPGFAASFDALEFCADTGWWVDIELENTGGTTFQSMSLTVTDTVTNTVLPLDAPNFTDNSGCLASVTRPDLPPGEARIVSSPPFSHDLSGHQLVSRITLCSDRGLSGICTSRVIEFTP